MESLQENTSVDLLNRLPYGMETALHGRSVAVSTTLPLTVLAAAGTRERLEEIMAQIRPDTPFHVIDVPKAPVSHAA